MGPADHRLANWLRPTLGVRWILEPGCRLVPRLPGRFCGGPSRESSIRPDRTATRPPTAAPVLPAAGELCAPSNVREASLRADCHRLARRSDLVRPRSREAVCKVSLSAVVRDRFPDGGVHRPQTWPARHHRWHAGCAEIASCYPLRRRLERDATLRSIDSYRRILW